MIPVRNQVSLLIQMRQVESAQLLLQRRANAFMVVTRGIHKGRLAIDLSNSRSLELNQKLTDAMINRFPARPFSRSVYRVPPHTVSDCLRLQFLLAFR